MSGLHERKGREAQDFRTGERWDMMNKRRRKKNEISEYEWMRKVQRFLLLFFHEMRMFNIKIFMLEFLFFTLTLIDMDFINQIFLQPYLSEWCWKCRDLMWFIQVWILFFSYMKMSIQVFNTWESLYILFYQLNTHFMKTSAIYFLSTKASPIYRIYTKHLWKGLN